MITFPLPDGLNRLLAKGVLAIGSFRTINGSAGTSPDRLFGSREKIRGGRDGDSPPASSVSHNGHGTSTGGGAMTFGRSSALSTRLTRIWHSLSATSALDPNR